MSERDFTELIETHQNIIHKICSIYTVDRADHEDLFQEIVYQAWKSFGRFKGESKETTWLYRVGLYTALTQQRKKKVDLSAYRNELQFESADDQSEQQISHLYMVLEALNDADKALTLLYLENRSYKEIAEILGITENNVGVRMNRMKKKLKELWNSKN